MSHAFLDSLSEDWPSQPASPDESKPPTLNGTTTSSFRFPGTKIPRPRSSHAAERSQSEINIPIPAAANSSKPPSYHGHRATKSNVDSPAGSIVHNTVHHRSNSVSQGGGDKGNTPEWKRRLIYGDLAYGEQRDLFTSAANGLEGMFRPPVATAPSRASFAQPAPQPFSRNSSAMTPSPPLEALQDVDYESDSDRSMDEEVPAQHEQNQLRNRPMQYRLNDDSPADVSQISTMSSPAPFSPGRSSQLSPFSRPVGVPADGSRAVSSLSAAQHEDFSPILIAKRSSDDGKIDFAPVGVSAAELRQRLESLQDEPELSETEEGASRARAEPSSKGGLDSLKQLNGYVRATKAGLTPDDYFGDHVFSPGMRYTSDMFPESSLQASTPKQFPSIRIHEPESLGLPLRPHVLPAAPHPSPEKRKLQIIGAEAASAGISPLKLFGPYDTFTNKTLLDRISQFEDPNSTPASERPMDERKASVDVLRYMVQPTSRGPSSTHAPVLRAPETQTKSTRVVSQFGAGQLDGYAFNDDFTRHSADSGDGSVLHHSVTFDPNSSLSPPSANNIIIGKRRQKPESTSSTGGMSLSREFAGRPMEILPTPLETDLMGEIKRQRTSPSKNPTPKRRRTLHQADIAFMNNELEPASEPEPAQLLIGKKRAGGRQSTPNSNIPPLRQAPRPWTPTPRQPSSLRREIHLSPDSFLEQEIAKLPRKGHSISQLQDGFGGEGRKPSIRTEDFLNEAQRIMVALRRRKAGLPSGLTSLEESEEEFRKFSNYTADDASYQDSTEERFSRPPSREGQPIPRVNNRQEDPKLVNHLKKYEDHSDMEDIIATSLRSIGVSKEDIKAAQALERITHSSNSGSSNLDIPDSVIGDDAQSATSQRNTQNRYEHSTAAEQAERFRHRFPSNISDSGSKFSTIRTNSSKNSDNRRTIAPGSVSHLIPDEINGMVFDKERQRWEKATAIKVPRAKRTNTLLSENSEDDIFADIPDLTVDMMKEKQALRLKKQREEATGTETPDTDPSKRPSKLDPNGMLKSILVKDFADRSTNNDMSRSPSRLMRQFAEADDEDVENEISINNDYWEESSPKRRTQVNFSSPVSIVIQDKPEVRVTEEHEARTVEPVVLHLTPSAERTGHPPVSFQSPGNNIQARRNPSNGPSRQIAVQGEPFVPRPVSVIEEQDEDSQRGTANSNQALSVVPDQSLAGQQPSGPVTRQPSLNIVLSGPARPQTQPRPENADIISHYVGDISLSALSDFTAHRERSYALDVSYVLGDHNLVTGDGSKEHLPEAIRHLVDKIAEVEAFEPFWEDMKDIQLRDKKLNSLHMLDRFCGRLVKVDASDNLIRALDGVPSSVRELHVSHNMLSSLTAWDRLSNLQFVDVSNNEIKSLAAFQNLIHLRDLVANNTGLVNLDGIKYHETLLTLRARGNKIQELDFDGTTLERLTALDLEGNELVRIANLHELSSLSHLNLSGNKLVELEIDAVIPLKTLMISDNRLKRLDVSAMPRLQILYADRNKLTTVHGLERTSRLDSLSLKEQGGWQPFDMTTLARAYEVRKLFLSGNRLGNFVPPRDFLNLQLLDLANCGLQHLPGTMGDMMPNLRVLNLNFNGLSDISGLLGIPRLKRLFLAGNRFVAPKPLLKILAEFPWLAEVDLRDTFVTQGFYPTVQRVVQRDIEIQHKRQNQHQYQQAISSTDQFKLPNADPSRDAKFCRLLDMDTRIQRRTYERKFIKSCAQLQKLDGLPVNKKIRHLKDIVWKTMVERGLLLRPDGSAFDVSCVTLEDEIEELSSYMAGLVIDKEPPRSGGAAAAAANKRKTKVKQDDNSRRGAEDNFA
ncbi:hypothetical protein BD289DRAFT_29323 [Coniella lustricola]|uniref:Septation initiation network scaffold protein cdc11 n=1 Tax=Coniella lustricola TaxID=2025994 RepID=A0A2T3AJ36_9PEZI|nr:hypothetical protein BD289DRAFT_29323 [Coniella lustricola]